MSTPTPTPPSDSEPLRSPAPPRPDPVRRPEGPPKVLAVLVAHDGAEWVLGALRTLRAQGYPNLDVIAVDNASTDTSGELLRRRLPEDRVVTLERNQGFGRAVVAALRATEDEDIDYVLLVHDDMALMPDAVQWLVGAMEEDPSLAIVGPKLREWADDPLLQQVGMSADAFGRAEDRLDADELDQGQHDSRGDVLWVSSAGMLLRRDALATLGGFDSRFDQFRDDMDLCWRAWVTGRRVAVVPSAVGYHLAASAHHVKGRRSPEEARYRIERHTLASMLKNYSGRRLAWVLPLGALIDVLRILGLVLSRRFAEGFAMVRAYLWNLAQLPATLRRRRAVQAARRQPDSRLSSLFTPGLPRLRRYGESIMELASGDSTQALVDADDVTVARVDPLADQPVQRFLRDRPLVLLGIPLLLAFLVSLSGFLGEGQLVGGEISPWPEDATAFLQSYLSPWGGEPLASASFPSPVQAVLGILSTLLGSAWLAQRVLVFGLIPLAFVVTLRAGRLVTSRPWPRVIGAAVYVTSPVVLGSLGEGRYGVAVVSTLLPGIVALVIRATDPSTNRGVAWRSTALLSLAVLLALGSAPVEGLLAPAVVLVGMVVALLRGWIRPLLRLAVGGASAVVMLAPWLFDVIRDGGPSGGTLATDGGPPAILGLPLWQAIVGQPRIVDGLDGALGWTMLAIPGAILLGALVVGMRARPLITGALVLLVVTSGAAGWAASFYRLPLVWPPALLLPGAVALAVLAMIVARWSTETLLASDFGAGQVGTGVAAMGIAVGLVAGIVLLAGGPWIELRQDPQLLPAFIGADVDQLGEYRVLLLDRAEDGTVRWEVTGAQGPTMVSFGTIRNESLTRLLDTTVTQAVAGVGDSPGAVLGLLNVRYVVLLAPDAEIQASLAGQRALEPLPSTAAVAYRVSSWLPRASVVPEPAASQLLASGLPSFGNRTAEGALVHVGPGEYSGGTGGATDGLLVLSEADSGSWRAADAGGELERVELPPVTAFRVDNSAEDRFRVVAAGGLRRRAVVAVQLLVALGVISLALRPPGRREDDEPVATMPTELVGLADTTTVIPRIDPNAPPPGTTDGSTRGGAR